MNFSEVKDKQDDQLCNQSQHVKKPAVYDEELNHKEGDEDSQWNASLNLSNLGISSQEKEFCSFDFIEENNDISFETSGRNQNLKFDISNEVFDVSFENDHDNSFQGSFEKQSDNVQVELEFEQPYWGKKMIKRFERYHVFYDPVAKYMDRL